MSNQPNTTRTHLPGISTVNNFPVTGVALPEGWSIEQTVMGNYSHELKAMRWSHSVTLVNGPMSKSYSPWCSPGGEEMRAERARWVCHGESLEENAVFHTKKQLVAAIQATTIVVHYSEKLNEWYLSSINAE